MLVRGKFAGAMIVVLVAVAAAPSAEASDASIKAAWDANDAQFTKLGKQQRRAIAAWRRSGFAKGKSGAVLRSIAATRKVLATNTRAVRAQPESTPTGARAQRYALASNASFDRSQVLAARGIRLTTAGKRAAGNRRLASAEKAIDRSGRQAAAVKRLFKAVL